MPKLNIDKVPKQCNDRGRSYSWHEGKRVYHGVAGTPEANRNYMRFVNDLTKEPPLSPPPPDAGASVGTAGAGNILVAELCDAFLKYAVKAKSPSDYSNYKTACEGLLRYAGSTTAEFDAFMLLQVQGGFVEADYARTHCNKLVNFCVHIFKWGEVRRLVPPGKSVQLQAVEPLRSGAARETEERTEVPDEVVEQTLPYLLPVYRAFVRILRSTGARPSELCRMKVSDIDRKDPETWIYKPKHHKTARSGKRRIIAFGREEQANLLPYLGKEPSAAVFSPKDAVSEHKKLRRDMRTTPVAASQKRDEQRKQHPQVKFNEHFTVGTIGLALQRTILKANRELQPDQQIQSWTLYQLRHAFLTEMTERYDENVAALLAGHTDPEMVRRIYDHSQERRIKRLKQEQNENKGEATDLKNPDE